MKVCVIGAGAIGGLLATKLSIGGEDVSVIDRGPHLAAIRSNGLQLRWCDGTIHSAKVKAFEKASDVGEQDLIVLAVKAYDLEHVAENIHHMLSRDTAVMTVQNGIPWWYFQRTRGVFNGTRLASLDPSGILFEKIDANRIIGCVAYPAAARDAPGIIHHVEGQRFPVGEIDGRESKRAVMISEVLNRSGFKSRVISDIRGELWLKALGSISFNPISALTHATMAGICRRPETRQLAVSMMEEAVSVAEKLGITFRHTIEQRVEGAEKVGEHKTSMLQDLEAGNRLETEALMGAILEMGRLTGTRTPIITTVYALIKLLEQTVQNAGSSVLFDNAANKAA